MVIKQIAVAAVTAMAMIICTALAATGLHAQTMNDTAVLPDVPEGAQAVSVPGEPLYSPAPAQALVDNLDKARIDWTVDRVTTVGKGL